MEQAKKPKTVYSGDPKTGKYNEYPAEPSTWESVKESFLPQGERVNLEAVRKRRQAARDT